MKGSPLFIAVALSSPPGHGLGQPQARPCGRVRVGRDPVGNVCSGLHRRRPVGHSRPASIRAAPASRRSPPVGGDAATRRGAPLDSQVLAFLRGVRADSQSVGLGIRHACEVPATRPRPPNDALGAVTSLTQLRAHAPSTRPRYPSFRRPPARDQQQQVPRLFYPPMMPTHALRPSPISSRH